MTGHVVVADPGNHRVQVLDAEFKHIFIINKYGSGRELKLPGRVAVNKSGEIIIYDYQANIVSIYSQTGSHSRQFPGPWNKPLGIAVDSDGTIYVCDSGQKSSRCWTGQVRLSGHLEVVELNQDSSRTYHVSYQCLMGASWCLMMQARFISSLNPAPT